MYVPRPHHRDFLTSQQGTQLNQNKGRLQLWKRVCPHRSIRQDFFNQLIEGESARSVYRYSEKTSSALTAFNKRLPDSEPTRIDNNKWCPLVSFHKSRPCAGRAFCTLLQQLQNSASHEVIRRKYILFRPTLIYDSLCAIISGRGWYVRVILPHSSDLRFLVWPPVHHKQVNSRSSRFSGEYLKLNKGR